MPETMTNSTEFGTFASAGSVGVDAEKGVIYGVSIITKGEAKGHGMYVDDTMLQQVYDLGSATGEDGLQCDFDHANPFSRSVGTYVGRFRNFRLDGEKVRADLFMSEVAAQSPEGDLRSYVMGLAGEDPKAFATSIVFRQGEPFMPDTANMGKEGFPDEDDPYWFPHARAVELTQCDVVGNGAANDGLFGRPLHVAETIEKLAEKHPSLIGRILERYHEWARKQKEDDMSDELKQAVEDAETALAAANDQIVELTEGNQEKVDQAAQEAKEAAFALVADRMEQYEDAAFVVANIALSEDEWKDTLIAKLQEKPEVKESGEEKTVEMAAQDDKKSEKFEDVVEGFVAEGMTKTAALKKAAREYVDLHKDYVKRINA